MTPRRQILSTCVLDGAEVPHLQFGHGSRTCIGKHISLLEITKVIPQMVRKFDFEFAEDYKDGWTTETRWFCKQKYECHIKPRAQ